LFIVSWLSFIGVFEVAINEKREKLPEWKTDQSSCSSKGSRSPFDGGPKPT
jgi:PIN domain nuclease of toxin-antitoxin system